MGLHVGSEDETPACASLRPPFRPHPSSQKGQFLMIARGSVFHDCWQKHRSRNLKKALLAPDSPAPKEVAEDTNES